MIEKLKRFWKTLKKEKEPEINSSYWADDRKDTPHSEWLKGYWKWKKSNGKEKK